MKVCRTCLEILNNDTKCVFVDSNNGSLEPSIRRKLLVCVPEMELDIQQAIMCLPCSNALDAAYDFKNKCLQTEEKISNYVRHAGCSRESINISAVANFNETSNDSETEYIKSVNDIHYPIMEIVEHDTDVDVKPILCSDDSDNLFQSNECEFENVETDIKVKSEQLDLGTANINDDCFLPENVIFSSELDVEVRPYKNNQATGNSSSVIDYNAINYHLDLKDSLSIMHNCTFCERSFSTITELHAHLSSHMTNRPLQCTLCERRFVRKDKLQLHMRTHTGEKPFECPVCGRCFSRKDKVTIHMRTHTGEKPHQCILCQKSFARKDKMNAHMKTQHWVALSNLEITVVKNEGMTHNMSENNVAENSGGQ